MDRALEKARLIRQKQTLAAKYPPSVYAKLKEEPLDILRHVREVIRYGADESEYFEIAFIPRSS